MKLMRAVRGPAQWKPDLKCAISSTRWQSRKHGRKLRMPMRNQQKKLLTQSRTIIQDQLNPSPSDASSRSANANASANASAARPPRTKGGTPSKRMGRIKRIEEKLDDWREYNREYTQVEKLILLVATLKKSQPRGLREEGIKE